MNSYYQRSYFKLAWVAAVTLALLGCEKREPIDPYYFMQPQLPVLTPMKLDRAGAKYTLNFWVVPELGSKTTYGYFIGIRSTLFLERDGARISEVRDFLRDADMPLEVKLIKLNEPSEKTIQLYSPPKVMEAADGKTTLKYTPLRDNLASVRQLADADYDLLIKNRLYDLKRDANIDHRYFQFAEVQTPEPGYYRLEVRVLKDTSRASDLATDLIVSNHRKGK